jgi:two-component system, chemotaxis family, CheB/CheR fusion protein
MKYYVLLAPKGFMKENANKNKKIRNLNKPKINGSQKKVKTKDTSLPIVGIGASAGGIAAFEKFFFGFSSENIEINVAFVLVQHLDPHHESLLSEILRRYTKMNVFEVEEGMIAKPGCVYIIPPNRDMAIYNGTFSLLEPALPRGLRMPIDFFFKSLAIDRKQRAISIVLSGTGSDGTLGARAIKAEGGMVVAQKPESAEYDSMPKSVIEANLVYILPPEEMPTQLVSYVTNDFLLNANILPQGS